MLESEWREVGGWRYSAALSGYELRRSRDHLDVFAPKASGHIASPWWHEGVGWSEFALRSDPSPPPARSCEDREPRRQRRDRTVVGRRLLSADSSSTTEHQVPRASVWSARLGGAARRPRRRRLRATLDERAPLGRGTRRAARRSGRAWGGSCSGVDRGLRAGARGRLPGVRPRRRRSRCRRGRLRPGGGLRC